jgi:hypothetical protein
MFHCIYLLEDLNRLNHNHQGKIQTITRQHSSNGIRYQSETETEPEQVESTYIEPRTSDEQFQNKPVSEHAVFQLETTVRLQTEIKAPNDGEDTDNASISLTREK